MPLFLASTPTLRLHCQIKKTPKHTDLQCNSARRRLIIRRRQAPPWRTLMSTLSHTSQRGSISSTGLDLLVGERSLLEIRHVDMKSLPSLRSRRHHSRRICSNSRMQSLMSSTTSKGQGRFMSFLLVPHR